MFEVYENETLIDDIVRKDCTTYRQLMLFDREDSLHTDAHPDARYSPLFRIDFLYKFIVSASAGHTADSDLIIVQLRIVLVLGEHCFEDHACVVI